MKKNIVTLLLSVAVGMATYGQVSTAQNGLAGGIPAESVFVQYNESLLFSGESLLYKVYCLNNRERQLTSISKMAYVSLVDKDGKPVFTHKIRLNDGAGYGDFFVPTSIPTGSYKLLGYSEWMKNFGSSDYFQSDIHIVNPYQPIPETHREQVLDSLQNVAKTPSVPRNTNGSSRTTQDQFVDLVLSKSDLGMRDKLELSLTAKSADAAQGSYAISIRKVDEMPAPGQTSSTAFYREFTKKGSSSLAATAASNLPELRGEVISGKIVNKETKLPAGDVRISLSLPGEQFLFNVASSGQDGTFRFVVDQEYDNVTGALQILAENWDQYAIEMDEKQQDYPGVQVSNFKLSQEMTDYILQKSIQNQIENGYRQVKSDESVPAQHKQPYYRNFSVSYDLDDYTRFNSIQETIVEVVDQVAVRKLSNGDRVFEIRPEEGFTDLNLLPMVFVDGLFIKRHEDFMDFSAKKIKNINFSRNKVILGPQVFQGVLSFNTVEGGFYNTFYTPHIVNLDLFKPQANKNYFAQDYTSGAGKSRIPDFRNQLLWEPNLDLSEGSKALVLYTSDVAGTYEVVLEGFAASGIPISLKQQFEVR